MRGRPSSRRRVLVGACFAAVCAAGCTLIAGIDEGILVDAGADGGGIPKRDATSGSDGAKGDGGKLDGAKKDGTTGDGGAPRDAHVGKDASDGGGPSTYACSVTHDQPVSLGSIGLGSGNFSYSIQIFLESSLGQEQLRVLTEDPTSNLYEAFTFGNGGVTQVALAATNVLAVTRYPTGIAALIEVQAPVGMYNTLSVVTLADGADSGGWVNQVIFQDQSILNACTEQLQGELVVNDAAQQDYTLAWTCITGGPSMLNVLRYVGGASTVTSWPWAQDAGANGLQLSGLAENASNIYLLSSPSDMGAPAPGSTPTVDSLSASFADAQAPTAHVLPLVDASDFLMGLALSVTNNDDLGVALVQGNVNAPSGDLVAYAGSVSGTKLATLNAQTGLLGTPVASIGDAPFFRGTPHWESFPSPALPGDNLLAIGPDVTTFGGLDFLWWNGAGQLLAQNVGTSAFLYEPEAGTNGSLLGAAITFVQPPVTATAKLEIAYLLADPDGTTIDVMANEVDCFAAPTP
jgi:hypothetical protein